MTSLILTNSPHKANTISNAGNEKSVKEYGMKKLGQNICDKSCNVFDVVRLQAL